MALRGRLSWPVRCLCGLMGGCDAGIRRQAAALGIGRHGGTVLADGGRLRLGRRWRCRSFRRPSRVSWSWCGVVGGRAAAGSRSPAWRVEFLERGPGGALPPRAAVCWSARLRDRVQYCCPAGGGNSVLAQSGSVAARSRIGDCYRVRDVLDPVGGLRWWGAGLRECFAVLCELLATGNAPSVWTGFVPSPDGLSGDKAAGLTPRGPACKFWMSSASTCLGERLRVWKRRMKSVSLRL